MAIIKESQTKPNNPLLFEKLKKIFWEKEKEKRELEGGMVQNESPNSSKKKLKTKKII